MVPRHVFILICATFELVSQFAMSQEDAKMAALSSGKSLLEAGIRGLRVINGTNVDPPYKFPSIVGIWWNGCPLPGGSGSCKEPGYICAGSIYDKHWVVSAAHCGPTIKKPGVLFVIAGIHDISKPLEMWSQNVSVVEIVQHELYGKPNRTTVNDIALYRVHPALKFSDKVTPMNIADFYYEASGNYNETAIVVGWGDQGKEPYNPVLQEAKLPLITIDLCRRFYGWYNLNGKNFSQIVNHGMICTYEENGGKDACVGDSGGPLFIYHEPDDTYTQIGIVSWGVGCAQTSFPGVYTRIGHFASWIENEIQTCRPRKT